MKETNQKHGASERSRGTTKSASKRRILSTTPYCRYCKAVVLPDNIVKEKLNAKNDILQCTTTEARKNVFFRQGDPQHVFEFGQLQVQEWQDRHEEDVLIERVTLGQKPVACIVLCRGAKLVERIRKHHTLLSFVHGKNEWGCRVLNITCRPNATLLQLLRVRSKREKSSVLHLTSQYARELESVCVKDYLVAGGFDMQASLAYAKVNVLESALLYGFPLDFAASFHSLHFHKNRKNGGLLL